MNLTELRRFMNELPSRTGRPLIWRQWIMFLLACATSFILYLHRYTWNFIGPELKREYGWSDTQVGTLGGMFNWTYGTLQIPSGMIADFFGPHLFLGTIIALWSLVLALHGMPNSFYGLGAARLGFGIGQAGAYPSLTKITHSWIPRRLRTSAQAMVATLSGRGGAFVSPILFGTVLMGWCGLTWRKSLLILAAIGFVFAAIFLVLFRNSPGVDVDTGEAPPNKPPQPGDSQAERRTLPWGQALSSRSMWFFIVQQITSAGSDGLYSLFLGGYFLTNHGLTIQEAGFYVGLPLLGGAVGGTAGGFLNDFMIWVTGSYRWGRSLVGLTGKVVAAGLMLIAVVQANPLFAAVALFFVKFFTDWSQPTVWGTCTDLGGRYSATVFGIINTSGSVGGILCPPLFGLVLDSFPETITVGSTTQTAPGYDALFLVVAAMYFVSGLCWLMIDCTRSFDPTTGTSGVDSALGK